MPADTLLGADSFSKTKERISDTLIEVPSWRASNSELLGDELMPSGCLAAIRFLEAFEPPLSPETMATLRVESPRQGLTLPVLRALGHDGLADVLGITSAVERARIIASEGKGIVDGPMLPRVLESPKRIIRIFEVRRVNFLQILSVDPINQRFDAHVFVELVIRDGALDEHLMQDTEEFQFPYPSARWFWQKQVDFSNSISHEVLESKVLKPKDCDDLVCQLRVRGTFSETLELTYFPFDFQDLTVTLEIKCAKEGPVPVQIRIADDVHTSVSNQAFSMSNVWGLSPFVRCSLGQSGVDLDTDRPKTYAALNCSAGVARLSLFCALPGLDRRTAGFSPSTLTCPAALLTQRSGDRDPELQTLPTSSCLCLSSPSSPYSVQRGSTEGIRQTAAATRSRCCSRLQRTSSRPLGCFPR